MIHTRSRSLKYVGVSTSLHFLHRTLQVLGAWLDSNQILVHCLAALVISQGHQTDLSLAGMLGIPSVGSRSRVQDSIGNMVRVALVAVAALSCAKCITHAMPVVPARCAPGISLE